MLLQDFNYFINKAINQYINKRYNIYDVNMQTTDDLRVLKSTAILTPKPTTVYGNTDIEKNLFGSTFEVELPIDYLHMLNCICIYHVDKRYKCYDENDIVQFAAKKLSADSWSVIVNDYYNRPLPERPYYYIHNVNNSDGGYPTNPANNSNNWGTDMPDSTDKKPFSETISLRGGGTVSTIEKEAGYRYGNASRVRCEIRYGKDSDVFRLVKVYIDYIKAPQTIRLTQTQIDKTVDTSQIMEFPDYVCQEIINELVTLVMENTADPRLQTHFSVTQSIANPAQQQTQTPTKQG